MAVDSHRRALRRRGAAPTEQLRQHDPEYGYSYNGLAKIDYTINEETASPPTGSWARAIRSRRSAPRSRGTTKLRRSTCRTTRIVYNHVFSPSITNQVLAGVNYFNQVFNDFNNGFDAASWAGDGLHLPGAPNIDHRLRSHRRDASRGPQRHHRSPDRRPLVGDRQSPVQVWRRIPPGAAGRVLPSSRAGQLHLRRLAGAGRPDATDSWDIRRHAGSMRSPIFLPATLNTSSIALGDPDRQVFVNTYRPLCSGFLAAHLQAERELWLALGLRRPAPQT